MSKKQKKDNNREFGAAVKIVDALECEIFWTEMRCKQLHKKFSPYTKLSSRRPILQQIHEMISNAMLKSDALYQMFDPDYSLVTVGDALWLISAFSRMALSIGEV